MTDRMPWSEERTDHLKTLWTEGRTASEIAAHLGGVTRSAVIGKIHRLGLPGHRRSPAQPRPKSPARRRARGPHKTKNNGIASYNDNDPLVPALPEENLPPLGPAPAARITITELETGLCRWPEGDPKTPAFHFCGRAANGTYCTHHTARAHRRIMP